MSNALLHAQGIGTLARVRQRAQKHPARVAAPGQMGHPTAH